MLFETVMQNVKVIVVRKLNFNVEISQCKWQVLIVFHAFIVCPVLVQLNRQELIHQALLLPYIFRVFPRPAHRSSKVWFILSLGSPSPHQQKIILTFDC